MRMDLLLWLCLGLPTLAALLSVVAGVEPGPPEGVVVEGPLGAALDDSEARYSRLD